MLNTKPCPGRSRTSTTPLARTEPAKPRTLRGSHPPWLPKVATALFTGVVLSTHSPAVALAEESQQGNAVQEVQYTSSTSSVPAQTLAVLPAPPLEATLGFLGIGNSPSSVKQELDGVTSQLQKYKEREAAEALEIQDLQAKLGAEEKAVRNTPESVEIRDLRAQVAAKEQALRQLAERGTTGDELASSLAAVQPSTGGDVGGNLLNVAGIFTLGALGGVYAIQKKGSEESASDLSSQLGDQKKLGDGLKKQALEVRDSLSAEERLAAKLRIELKAASDKENLMLTLKKAETEAMQRTLLATQKAADVEKGRVVSLRKEIAASTKVMEESKSTAEAIKDDTAVSQIALAEANTQLGRERKVAMKVGSDARVALDKVKDTQGIVGQKIKQRNELQQEVISKVARAVGAESEVSVLRQQVAQATSEMNEQKDLATRLGNEASRLKAEMTEVKLQSSNLFTVIVKEDDEIGFKLQATSAEKRKADAELEAQKALLAKSVSDGVALAASIKESEQRIVDLEAELLSQGTTSRDLAAKMGEVREEVTTLASNLASGKKTNSAAKAQVALLRAELLKLQSELNKNTKKLNQELGLKASMERSLVAVSEELKMTMVASEREKSLAAALQRQSQIRQQQVSEEKSSNSALKKQMDALDESTNQKLQLAIDKLGKAVQVQAQAEAKSKELADEVEVTKKKLKVIEAAADKSTDMAEALSEQYRQEVADSKAQVQRLEKVAQVAGAEDEAMGAKLAEMGGHVEKLRQQVADIVKSSATSAGDLMTEQRKRGMVEADLEELSEQLDVIMSRKAGAKSEAEADLKQLKGLFENLKNRVEAKSAAADKVAGSSAAGQAKPKEADAKPEVAGSSAPDQAKPKVAASGPLGGAKRKEQAEADRKELKGSFENLKNRVKRESIEANKVAGQAKLKNTEAKPKVKTAPVAPKRSDAM